MAITFPHGEAEILARDVVLIIDKGLALDARNGPERLFGAYRHVTFDRAEVCRGAGETHFRNQYSGLGGTFRQACGNSAAGAEGRARDL